jgi:hypothetical protein
MTSVTATDSAIAALRLNEAEISVEDERSESHMLTMMRKYKKAAMTTARRCRTWRQSQVLNQAKGNECTLNESNFN